jgi:hypothetical protein
MTKAREDLGYTLESGFRQYVEVLCEEAGLDPL